MERRHLCEGMQVAVKPSGGRRGKRSVARRRAMIDDLAGAKPDHVIIRWLDSGQAASVPIARLAYPLPSA